MNPEKIKELTSDLDDASLRLKEALAEDPATNTLAIDGTIKRFEFSFELAWKLAKAILEQGGLDLGLTYPRMILKEAFARGLIKDDKNWLQMLEDRNKTTHIYDQAHARQIYDRIKACYAGLISALALQAKKL